VSDITEIKISFNTLDEFKAEWEKNISKGGIFTKADPSPAARQPLPPIRTGLMKLTIKSRCPERNLKTNTKTRFAIY